MFSVKDPILAGSVQVQFARTGCKTCYFNEAVRHFSMGAKDHLATDRASHFFKHLQNPEHYIVASCDHRIVLFWI